MLLIYDKLCIIQHERIIRYRLGQICKFISLINYSRFYFSLSSDLKHSWKCKCFKNVICCVTYFHNFHYRNPFYFAGFSKKKNLTYTYFYNRKRHNFGAHVFVQTSYFYFLLTERSVLKVIDIEIPTYRHLCHYLQACLLKYVCLMNMAFIIMINNVGLNIPFVIPVSLILQRNYFLIWCKQCGINEWSYKAVSGFHSKKKTKLRKIKIKLTSHMIDAGKTVSSSWIAPWSG